MSFKPAASLTEQIANHLSDEIITGRLAPLERIQELKVAKDLGVSRGSVREALLIVEGRHLIDIIPRRGAVVSGLEPIRIADLTEFYGELVLMVLTRVAARGTGNGRANVLDGFRCAIAQMGENLEPESIDALITAKLAFFQAGLAFAGNSYLSTMLSDLTPAMHRVSRRAAEHPHFDSRDVTRFARALLDAMVGNDRTRLGELVRAHFRREATLALDTAVH
jgi:GntR family transcriptional regulator, rspAB operon transcriptional repressor